MAVDTRMAVYVALETRLDTAAFGDNHRLFAWKAIYKGLVNAQFIQGAKADPQRQDAATT